MSQNLERLVGNSIFIGSPYASSGSRTASALDSAYSHLTSGDAIAIRYMAQVASTIDEVYIFMDDYAGTLGNISIGSSIYAENTTPRVARPGSTVLWPVGAEVVTCTMPDAADKWIKIAYGSPLTTTVGQIVWIVFFNAASSPGTDYPSILHSPTTQNAIAMQGHYNSTSGYYTSAGFSSDGGLGNELPFVIKHGSIYVGNPFTRVSGSWYTNGTLERGIQFTPTEDVTVVTGEFISGLSAYSDLRILADSTLPGGTALYSYDLDSDSGETICDFIGAKYFDTPVTLTGGVTYKLTLTMSSSTASPPVLEIEDYSSYSTMFDTLRGYDTFRHPWGVVSDGGSPAGWTIQKAVCPSIGMKIVDFPSQSDGGGGPLVGGRLVR